MELPTFENKKELFKYLIENKKSLIAQKKATIKHADSISYLAIENKKDVTTKANEPIDINGKDSIIVKVVMNTTNLLDSHGDVHISGIWNKTLKEAKFLMHLQEHENKFDKIIADGKNVKTSLKEFAWSELGYNYKDSTQALIFESKIERNRNTFMFKQYANGYVKNHSVGMQYVKLQLAVNDKDYTEEFSVWEKYFPIVANKADAEKEGYFWAVTEAKLFEGSAVVRGSNFATPTLENNKTQLQNNIEPLQDTQQEIKDTQKEPSIEMKEFLKLLKQ